MSHPAVTSSARPSTPQVETHAAQPSDDMVPEAEIKRWHAALLPV
jgi:hypothetical protein